MTAEMKKMEKTKEQTNNGFVPVRPDFKGDGVAVWKATDKKGRQYLRVKVLGAVIACHERRSL